MRGFSLSSTDPAAPSRVSGDVPEQVLSRVMEQVRAQADPARAAAEKAYLKSALTFHGLTLPKVHAVERQIEAMVTPEQLRPVVERLWAEPVHEPRAVAVELLERRARWLTSTDLSWIEVILRDCHTWAYVDAIAVHAVGSVVEREPPAAAVLDRWIVDGDFWIRRSALLALLLPLRQGRGDPARFLRYAQGCLADNEVFIRKAVGWVLREMGKQRPAEVEAFVRAHHAQMSGLTFREAIRSQPAQVQEALRALRG
ncbi:DNA alkylation repair protein [Myxococcota bacterium]|nr:DNA alkylation repair protein [Myxococcota bacterium]